MDAGKWASNIETLNLHTVRLAIKLLGSLRTLAANANSRHSVGTKDIKIPGGRAVIDSISKSRQVLESFNLPLLEAKVSQNRNTLSLENGEICEDVTRERAN